jgi:beta-1,4-mannosyltransferase
MLDPAWVRRHHLDFDVFHLHFGFDGREPAELQALVDELRDLRKPFIHTVHDLRSPRQATPELHDARLDVLVPAADALITLTAGAAAEIEQRWGRRALVLPHPHVVGLRAMARMRRRRQTPLHRDRPFTVGLRIRRPRPSDDPTAVLPGMIRAVQDIPGAILQVDGHPDVLTPGSARFDSELAASLDDAPDCVRVRVRRFFGDDQMWDYVAGLDVSVLPYRFGTHSTWLEACRDIGTAVVAPSCGHFEDQAPVFMFTMDEERLDEESLVTAIRQAYEKSPIEPVTVMERVDQRQRLAEAHARLYLAALTE